MSEAAAVLDRGVASPDPQNLEIKTESTPDSDENPEQSKTLGDKAKNLLDKIKIGLNIKKDPSEILEDVAETGSPFTEQENEAIQDLVNKGEEFERSVGFLKIASEKLKDHPEIIGMLSATALGAMGIFLHTSIPSEVFSRMSAAIGSSTVGYMIGDTRSEKLRNAKYGALGGILVGEGASFVPGVGGKMIDAGVGYIDEVALGAMGAAALIKRQAGKHLPSAKMSEPVTREINPLSPKVQVEVV